MQGEKQSRAFKQICFSLDTTPMFLYLNFSVSFVLQTDASSIGIGAVLTQHRQDTRNMLSNKMSVSV